MAAGTEFRITRTLDAPLDLVWQAHTDPKHLMNWWGPKGTKMIAAEMDLKPGGLFHYGIELPDGNRMWGKFIYKEVVPTEKLVFIVSFSDKDGGTTRHPMSQTWPLEVLNTLTLEEFGNQTILKITGHPVNASPEETETFNGAFAGMTQGFKGTLDGLAEYLDNIQRA